MKSDDDRILFLMQEELKCYKATRTVLRERLLHIDHLIEDVEMKILEYANEEIDIKKHIE